ncbi:MAG TPA: PTS sugar transporter subunit IIB [Bacillota bacterium]
MTIAHIVLVRVDDRLIHGQVMAVWSKALRFNRIVIADDGLATDPFISKVLRLAAPPGIEVLTSDVTAAAGCLCEEAKPGVCTLVLVKSPKAALRLLELGVQFKELNVGGMGAGPGRKPLYKNISAGREDLDAFRAIIGKGVSVIVRIVPEDRPVDLSNAIARG